MRINMLESLADNIVIDKDKCTFCGICVETCVLDNLRMKLSPCRQACPLNVNCHGYVQLIARGEEAKGLELLRQSLPFPGILGRICSQPCEKNCYRKEMDGDAVSVRALKRYLADGASDNDSWTPAMSPETARREANRCYSCGQPFGKYRNCRFCLPCEVDCPHDALWVEIPYLLR